MRINKCFKCQVQKVLISRGLCRVCYSVCLKMRKAGLTWEELEEKGHCDKKMDRMELPYNIRRKRRTEEGG